MKHLQAFAALVAIAAASWVDNMNYKQATLHFNGLGYPDSSLAKRSMPTSYQNASGLNFTHGVASGDPYPQSVILWTRLSPTMDNDRSNVTVSGYVPLYDHSTEPYVEASEHPVCATWAIATDKSMKHRVTGGQVFTSSEIDYTIKVEAKGLRPYTTYYYQFQACGSDIKSALGRTKTTPKSNDHTASIRLAVYSCSNYPFGFFNAYGNPVRKDSVDYVIHLGDYIYEYANGEYGWGQSIGRVPEPEHDIYTLYDYRRRIAQYRTDLDLVLSHSQLPWIPVWDDHEVADNSWRASSSELNNTEDSYIMDGRVSVDQRKMNAVRAYFEWLPIRQVESDDNLRIWRDFSIGNLVDLIMLDTRHYDRAITDLYWNTDYIHDISNDASRTMMGSRQENWFYDTLSSSAKRGAIWRVIGSQTVFERQNESFAYGTDNPLDYDAWDGYQANRNRTFQHLYDNNINNNIVISGDSHANWVSDLIWLDEKEYDEHTGAGSIGVEFAGTAVSSPSPYGQNITLASANNASSWLVNHNRELQWQEVYYRGYFELSLSRTHANASYFGMPTIVSRNAYEISLANFSILAGANRLTRPVAGGTVESGALKIGKTVMTNITNDTSVATGRYFISNYNQEDI